MKKTITILTFVVVLFLITVYVLVITPRSIRSECAHKALDNPIYGNENLEYSLCLAKSGLKPEILFFDY